MAVTEDLVLWANAVTAIPHLTAGAEAVCAVEILSAWASADSIDRHLTAIALALAVVGDMSARALKTGGAAADPVVVYLTFGAMTLAIVLVNCAVRALNRWTHALSV